jgi:hypothetical protein
MIGGALDAAPVQQEMLLGAGVATMEKIYTVWSDRAILR